MIILLPNTSNQTISVMPRTDLTAATLVSLKIRRDGDGRTETITNGVVSSNVNFTNIEFSCTILSEGSTYYLEITSDGNLSYRDKIYSTTQTDFTVKHKISQQLYTSSEVDGDNRFIV
tara:strand:- start:1725 stop:2078 length:354 start_codon:yes stop_codon:yes gene_type:complete